MNEILIADGKGRLGLRGPYFHLFWAPESQVDADDALASIEAMRSLGGTARPLLLEISGVTLSNAARAAFAHAQPASRHDPPATPTEPTAGGLIPSVPFCVPEPLAGSVGPAAVEIRRFRVPAWHGERMANGIRPGGEPDDS